MPYIAPEMVAGKDHGLELDWWTFGALLACMVFRQKPFGGETEEDACHAILYDEPRFIDPDLMDKFETTAASLIRKVTIVLYSYSSKTDLTGLDTMAAKRSNLTHSLMGFAGTKSTPEQFQAHGYLSW
jgi:Protein kinase domain